MEGEQPMTRGEAVELWASWLGVCGGGFVKCGWVRVLRKNGVCSVADWMEREKEIVVNLVQEKNNTN